MKILVILLVLMSLSSDALAFIDAAFDRAASAAALAEGADDLLMAVDDTSNTFSDLKKISSTVQDAKAVLSEVDAAYYDLEYITSDMDHLDETSAKLHALANKTRRLKRLAKTIGVIAIDANTATALESARTNALLDNIASQTEIRNINEENRRIKTLTYVAKREAQADRSLTSAIERQQKRDKSRGYTFHPFTVPSGEYGVKEKIIGAALGLNHLQGAL